MPATPPPFTDGANPWIYALIGFLSALLASAVLYIKRLKNGEAESEETAEDNGEELRIDNIGLSKKSEDLLELILDEPVLQNEAPGKLEVSKATVSNAVSELKERGLVRRKKKANTYLIEPDREELEKQQR